MALGHRHSGEEKEAHHRGMYYLLASLRTLRSSLLSFRRSLESRARRLSVRRRKLVCRVSTHQSVVGVLLIGNTELVQLFGLQRQDGAQEGANSSQRTLDAWRA